ncbi:hypothetical protein BH23GEM7_BH23GEM7_18210 [soil metagenome]
MKPWIKGAAAGVGALLGGVIVATAFGSIAWSRATSRTVERLTTSTPRAGAEIFSPEQLEGLPAPVARYFGLVLTPGQPLIRSARIEHEGEFRTGLDAPWNPFHSVQHFTADPPGFVWDASIRMAPLMNVRVRDSYIGGSAGMRGAVAGLVPVVDQQGTPDLAAGALHRYLAEAVWLPTALLPSQHVVWEAVDDSTALVTLSDSGITVTWTVHFSAAGEIVRVEGERLRDVDGVGVPTPFVGHHRSSHADPTLTRCFRGLPGIVAGCSAAGRPTSSSRRATIHIAMVPSTRNPPIGPMTSAAVSEIPARS